MAFYVLMGGRIVGWVIARNQAEALEHARIKFPSWDLESPEVMERRR